MLELKQIRKTFNPGTVNEKVALDGLDLTLQDGEFVTVTVVALSCLLNFNVVDMFSGTNSVSVCPALRKS